MDALLRATQLGSYTLVVPKMEIPAWSTETEFYLCEALLHIAPMECFRSVIGEIPKGTKLPDCWCYACTAYNALVRAYGQEVVESWLSKERKENVN